MKDPSFFFRARVAPFTLTLSSVIALFAGIATAQETQAPNDKGFTVEIKQPATDNLTYGDPIVIVVSIRTTRSLELGDLSLVPLGSLASVYGPPAKWEGRTCNTYRPERIEAGIQIYSTCQLKATDGWKFWKPSTWILAPATQRLALEIPVTIDTKTPHYEEIVLPFKAPLESIAIGGLIGALLLAIFTTIKGQLSKQLESVNIESWRDASGVLLRFGSWVVALAPQLWRTILTAIMGAICALILILLAQVTDGINPPVSIRVQDFWGGIVVGLFSIPLSQWLFTQLMRSDNPARPKKQSQSDD